MRKAVASAKKEILDSAKQIADHKAASGADNAKLATKASKGGNSKLSIDANALARAAKGEGGKQAGKQQMVTIPKKLLDNVRVLALEQHCR